MADETKVRHLRSYGSYVRSLKVNDPDAMNAQAWLVSRQGAVRKLCQSSTRMSENPRCCLTFPF